MADVAKVKADIKARLVDVEWREQYMTLAVIKSAFDALDASDGQVLKQGFLRKLDAEMGRFLRKKVEAVLSNIADTQIDNAIADNCLSLDEYERLI